MPKNLKKCMKLNWNFHRGGVGGGVLEKNPFCGEDTCAGYFLEFHNISCIS